MRIPIHMQNVCMRFVDGVNRYGVMLSLQCCRQKLVTLTTNHVVDFVEGPDARKAERAVAQAGSPAALVSDDRRVLPALGIQWATAVNMRIFIGKRSKRHKDSSAASVRELRLVFAPHVPPYTIDVRFKY